MTLPESTLSSGILDYDLKRWIAGIEDGTGKLSSHVKQLTRKVGFPSTLRCHDSSDFPYLSTLQIPTSHKSLARALFSVRETEGTLREGWIKRGHNIPIDGMFSRGLSGLSDLSPVTLVWDQRRRFWEGLLKRIFELRASSWSNEHEFLVYCPIGGDKVLTNGEYLIFSNRKESIVLSFNMFLMMKDLVWSWFLLHLNDDTSRYCMLSHNNLEFIFNWMTKSLVLYSDHAYDIIKLIEPLCKARIIQISERILDKNSFWNSMVSKGITKESQFPKYDQGVLMVSELADFIGGKTDLDELSEIFGLIKLAGHPHLDVIGGVADVSETGKARLNIRHEVASQLDHSACHVYLRGFIRKNKRWPPLVFLRKESDRESNLEKLSRSSHLNLPLGFTLYPESDWDDCLFAPHLEFNHYEDYLPLTVDKSLSLKRNEFDATWNGRLPYRPPKPSTSRRVLTEILAQDNFSIKDICNKVSTRSVPDDWKIVSVYPKEREMKKKSRLFSMMTIQMRYFFASLEQNIASSIFQNLPEQTMTDDRISVLERFFGMTEKRGKNVTSHIEIDFSAWNTHWKPQTYTPIGARIDQMFGTRGYFTYIHEFFESSLFNVKVPELVPHGLTRSNRLDPPEGPTIWKNHTGGCEGIAQKAWTFGTIALVHRLIWHLGVEFSLTGQGDNQVISLYFHFHDDDSDTHIQKIVQSRTKKVMTALEKGAPVYGHEIKAEECSASTSFVSYSKEMWVDGRVLSTSGKYLCRIFPNVTQDSPSTLDYVSSIGSGGLAATDRSLEPWSSYWLQHIVTAMTLNEEMVKSLLHGKTIGKLFEWKYLNSEQRDRLINLATVLPGPLGFFSTTSLFEYNNRGIPDPLESANTWLMYLESNQSIGRIIGYFQSEQPYSKNPSPKKLILDPFSAPIQTSLSPSTAVATAIKSKLLDQTRNPEIRELLEMSCQDDEEQLIHLLSTMTPNYAKIAHDLYGESITGVVDKFSRKFTNSRTMSTVSRAFGIESSDISMMADLDYISGMASRLSDGLRCNPGHMKRAFIQTNYMRSKWKNPPLGVLTVHPLDLGPIKSDTICEIPNKPIIIVIKNSDNTSDPFKTRGRETPYLGSSTILKTAYKTEKVQVKGASVFRCLKLLSIKKVLADPGGTADKLITRVVQSRLNFPVEQLLAYAPLTVGGTLGHRYDVEGAASGSFISYAPNVASHMSLSSNLMGELGSKDYPTMVQANFLTIESILASTWISGTGCVSARIEVDMEDMEEISESKIQIDQDTNYDPVKIRNPLVTSDLPHRKVRSSIKRKVALSEIDLLQSEGNVVDAIRKLARGWLRTGGILRNLAGNVISGFNYQTLIDQPEVRMVEWSDFRDGMAHALIDTISSYLASSSNRDSLVARLDRTVEELLYIVTPYLLGTAILLKNSPLNDMSTITSSEKCSIVSLSIKRQIKGLIPDYSFRLMLDDPSALSSDLRIILDRKTTALRFLSSQESLKAARVVNLISKTPVRSGMTADQSAEWVIGVMRDAPFLADEITWTSMSAIQILRNLRNRGPDETNPNDITRTLSVLTPQLPSGKMTCKDCIGSGAVLPMKETDTPYRYSSADQRADSWKGRKILVKGSSMYRWLPIRNMLSDQSVVTVVGIGGGGIASCLPDHSSVIGFDLRTSVSAKGHSFCNRDEKYERGVSVSINPSTWSGSGDIQDEEVQRCVIIAGKKSDVVIVDVESVNSWRRLMLRAKLAEETKSPVFVRVFDTEDMINMIEQSCCSLKTASTRFWRTSSDPKNEAVVGGDETPLGLYKAHGKHTAEGTVGWGNDLDEINPLLVAISRDLAVEEITKRGRFDRSRRNRRLKSVVS